MDINEIKNWMTKYNFEKLLLWIQAMSVHPNNQLYQLRFEYLLACLLSIKPNEFQHAQLDYKRFSIFVSNFFNKTNLEFYSLEDFHAFSQMNLIPYFFNGEKYYFFYGALERPREFIEKFDWMYLKAEIDSSIQTGLEELFMTSLKFQTGLLQMISSHEESLKTANSLYIPSANYLDIIGQCFQVSNVDNDACIKTGDFANKALAICKDNASILFNKLYIKSSTGETFFVSPQMHTEILFTIGDDLLYSDINKKMNLVSVGKALNTQFRELCEGFFSGFCVLDDIVNISNVSLLNPSELAVRVDENQIILFHFLRVRSNSTFNMESAIIIVKNKINEILSNGFIGLKFPYDNETHAMPPEILDVTGVIVFEHTGINLSPFGVNDIDICFFSLYDIKRIFEHLNSGEEFIKYIREKKFIHRIAQHITVDALDEFAYFLENGKKFFEGAKHPDLLSFAPHGWHDYYMEFVYKKYQDTVHGIIEMIHPYYYDVVTKQGEYTYEICNKRTLNGGTLLMLDNTIVLISYPIHMFEISNKQAVEIGEKFLKPMFSEYFIKLQKPYVDLLQKHGCQIREMIKVELCPIEEIGRKNRFKFLSEHLEEINDTKPFVITIRWNVKHQEKHLFFIYDTSKLHHIYSFEDNDAERLFIFELTKSFIQFYCNHYTNELVEKIAQDFVDINVPKSKRRYGIVTSQPRNPRLPEYTKYEDYNSTDVSMYNRKVAEHLMNVGFIQGKYEGEEVKKLNSETYRYLQYLLEKEITEFSHILLVYAYTQMELIEGEREIIRMQHAIDLQTDTDFDVVSKYSEKSSKISQLIVAVKHIIASILKAGVKGNKAIIKLEWQRLLAISIILSETTMLYELDEYRLIPYSITITDMFEINKNIGEYVFNSEKYQYEQSRVNVYNTKIKPYSVDDELNEINVANSSSSDSAILKGVNAIFKEKYDFSFSEMVNVIASLGMMDIAHDLNFPVNVVNKDILISALNTTFPQFSTESIVKIIDFLSLDFSSYSQNEDLITSRLMRKKERLNLCPIIALEDGKILYGNQMCLLASSFWVNSVTVGDYPYSINCPNEMILEMKKIHKQQDDELELEIERIAKEVIGDRYVVARLDKFTRISRQLPKNPSCGEIDLLVAIESSKTILVADAKNVNKRIRPYDIMLELRTFFDGEKSYLRKLQKKQEFIQENIDIFLEFFNIIDKSGWNAKKAFIVNHVYFSAFTDSDIEFILVGEFRKYLQCLKIN